MHCSWLQLFHIIDEALGWSVFVCPAGSWMLPALSLPKPSPVSCACGVSIQLVCGEPQRPTKLLQKEGECQQQRLEVTKPMQHSSLLRVPGALQMCTKDPSICAAMRCSVGLPSGINPPVHCLRCQDPLQ
jgi:hypothetical protein